MKIYHVETQEAYDELMIELEEKGYKWLSGCEPTSKNYWKSYNKNICIVISDKYITFGLFEQIKKQHQNTPIIEYKAKGENMTQEEMKRKLQKNAFDVYVAVETVAARGISKAEADLQEAKSSAKKLIEKIDDYLETLKPKFKVGDYATFDIPNNKKIAKINGLNGDVLYGLWYDTESENIKDDLYFGSGNKFRHATPTEILEYEMALAFHKHGRKPFEVKRGDIVYLKGYDKNIFLDSGNIYKKHNFIDGDVGLVKTVEEVGEWLGE